MQGENLSPSSAFDHMHYVRQTCQVIIDMQCCYLRSYPSNDWLLNTNNNSTELYHMHWVQCTLNTLSRRKLCRHETFIYHSVLIPAVTSLPQQQVSGTEESQEGSRDSQLASALLQRLGQHGGACQVFCVLCILELDTNRRFYNHREGLKPWQLDCLELKAWLGKRKDLGRIIMKFMIY